LVSLGVTAIVEALSNRLKSHFPDVTIIVFYVINLAITFSVVTALFGVIFKVLPDAKVKWKDVLAGAIATAILFMLGKFAISFYISKSNVGTTFGTAGSLVVLLLWIYFSSMILYFGAEFTKAYAMKYGGHIHPNEYAVVAHTIEVEHGKESIQEAGKKTEEIQENIKK
jgi:membrane protein